MVAARYASAITFDAKPISGDRDGRGRCARAWPEGRRQGRQTEEKKTEEAPRRKGFGLGRLGLSKGKQAESTQASASAGGRAVGAGSRRQGRRQPHQGERHGHPGGSRGVQEGHRLGAAALSLTACLITSGHLITSVAALAATLAISSLTAQPPRPAQAAALGLPVRRLPRRSTSSLLVRPRLVPCGSVDDQTFARFERLALAAGADQPASSSPASTRSAPTACRTAFPSILQDAIVIGLLAAGRHVRLRGQAADDVRGQRGRPRLRAAGHARQRVRRPGDPEREAVPRRRTGSRSGDFEGRVTEVTWRATKLRTKSGNFVILPNNIVGKEAIINYSEPVGADADRGRGRRGY